MWCIGTDFGLDDRGWISPAVLPNLYIQWGCLTGANPVKLSVPAEGNAPGNFLGVDEKVPRLELLTIINKHSVFQEVIE